VKQNFGTAHEQNERCFAGNPEYLSRLLYRPSFLIIRTLNKIGHLCKPNAHSRIERHPPLNVADRRMKLRYKIAGGSLIFLAVAILALALVLSHSFACGPAPSEESQVAPPGG